MFPLPNLYWLHHRHYNPTLGRFIQRDPIGIFTDTPNLGNGYAYVGNDPINAIDPSGLGPADEAADDMHERLNRPPRRIIGPSQPRRDAEDGRQLEQEYQRRFRESTDNTTWVPHNSDPPPPNRQTTAGAITEFITDVDIVQAGTCLGTAISNDRPDLAFGIILTAGVIIVGNTIDPTKLAAKLGFKVVKVGTSASASQARRAVTNIAEDAGTGVAQSRGMSYAYEGGRAPFVAFEAVVDEMSAAEMMKRMREISARQKGECALIVDESGVMYFAIGGINGGKLPEGARSVIMHTHSRNLVPSQDDFRALGELSQAFGIIVGTKKDSGIAVYWIEEGIQKTLRITRQGDVEALRESGYGSLAKYLGDLLTEAGYR